MRKRNPPASPPPYPNVLVDLAQSTAQACSVRHLHDPAGSYIGHTSSSVFMIIY